MPDFLMPSLGADMDEGTVVEWKVKPGDNVKRGDVVAVVETKKADIEIEIWESGVVSEILVPVGMSVAVGSPIARLGGDVVASPAPEPQPVAVPPAEVSPELSTDGGEKPIPPGRIRVSPLARKLAHELGVDLATVIGTGLGGAVSRVDIERAAAAALAKAEPAAPTPTQVSLAVPSPAPSAPAPAATPEGPRAPSSAEQRQLAMREAIGVLMTKSKQEIPHYYLGTHVDMEKAMAWLEVENHKRPAAERVLYSAMLIKAVALALREVPEMNGFWIGGEFHPSNPIHVGVAVSLRQGGLIAPAIHDTDHLSLTQIMSALRDLVTRARAGVLRSSEMSDPTITVTNLGEQGVETVYGVIYAPQVALVGFGKVTQKPWAEGGMMGIQRVIHATLSADHRVSDGHRGGLFLAAIERLLQEPEKL